MIIGSVKEIKRHEYRVGITPDNVKSFVERGHSVLIQTSAGMGSGFDDNDYSCAGAVLMDSAEEIWRKADMVIKVKEPLKSEYTYFQKGKILFTFLHLAANKPLADAMLNSGIRGVAYETLSDKNGGLPLLKPMSEIAGKLSVQEGAKYLERPFGGIGKLLGGVPGVPRANVVIIGGGVVGINACMIAIGMGADITILDANLDRLSYLDYTFGARIQTLYSTNATIENACKNADLVICAVLVPGANAPKLIKKEYLKNMKPGSVIVDVAVDQGGCCETSTATYHDSPTFIVDDIVHYCVANMPGAVPYTSSIALTNATLRYSLIIADGGLEAACKLDNGIASAVNIFDGQCTFKPVADAIGSPFIPLENVIELS